MSIQSSEEIEIKVALASVEEARKALDRTGFRISKPRLLETNTLYDTPDHSLRSSDELLRVRRVGDRTILTYKGAGRYGRHRSREEQELELSSASAFHTILEKLGYHPSFRYEKYRTEFEFEQPDGTATLDETPIGVFVELEGPPAWIDRTAEKMGFDERQYITKSYGALFEEWKRKHGSSAGFLTFEECGGLQTEAPEHDRFRQP